MLSVVMQVTEFATPIAMIAGSLITAAAGAGIGVWWKTANDEKKAREREQDELEKLRVGLISELLTKNTHFTPVYEANVSRVSHLTPNEVRYVVGYYAYARTWGVMNRALEKLVHVPDPSDTTGTALTYDPEAQKERIQKAYLVERRDYFFGRMVEHRRKALMELLDTVSREYFDYQQLKTLGDLEIVEFSEELSDDDDELLNWDEFVTISQV